MVNLANVCFAIVAADETGKLRSKYVALGAYLIASHRYIRRAMDMAELNIAIKSGRDRNG